MPGPTGRPYSARLLAVDRHVILGIVRALRAASGSGPRKLWRQLWQRLSHGSVRIDGSKAKIHSERLAVLREWADGHLAVVDERDVASGGSYLDNNMTSFYRALQAESFQSMLDDVSIPLVPVRLCGGTVARRVRSTAAVSAVRRSVNAFVPPVVDSNLPPAAVLPEPSSDVVEVDGVSFTILSKWRSTHRWYTSIVSRPRADRGAELHAALSAVAALSVRRGWRVMLAGAASLRARASLPAGIVVAGHEAALGRAASGAVLLASDMLWRATSRRQVYFLNRNRRASPEEMCVLMALPASHAAFDALSAANVPVERVVWMLIQGVHGHSTLWLASLFRLFSARLGRPVRVGFGGAGLNTVAMVLDEQLGADGWEMAYVAEANPYMAWVHRLAWGGRGYEERGRMEEPRAGSSSGSLLAVMLSLRCQPWCWLNRCGVGEMEGAAAERAAAYRVVAQEQPCLIIDEMLSRKRMAGVQVAWERIEFLRESILPNYRWVVCDEDPGCLPGSWMCSHREIVIGVERAHWGLLEEALGACGFWSK